MIKINEKNYELKYTIRALEQIEAVLGEGAPFIIRKSSGTLGLTELKTFFGYALFTEEGTRVSPQEGMKLCEELMQIEGYDAVNQLVILKIDSDLPFLFQVN